LSIPFYFLTIVLGWTGLIRLSMGVTSRFTADKNTQSDFSVEDIHSLANLGVRENVIDRQQAEVIQNILGLKSMTVRKIMTPRQVVFSLPADQTIEESIENKGNWPYSRIPLYVEGKQEEWIGIVLRRDAYNALAEGKRDKRLRDFMRPIQLVPDSLTLDKLLHRFLKQRGHIVGAVDEYGAMAGIASLEDVLEGILGREIVDEFDETVDLQEQARRKSIALAAINLRQNTAENESP
jgi:CBS domain containing-hemolysin-like protein